MNYEVLCGTEEQCYKCPFMGADEQRAQELGELAACFEGSTTLPSHKTISRVAELASIEADKVTTIKIRKAIIEMTLNSHCEVKEKRNGKDF